ncbi:MAG: PHP domain-containing protein, partial [Chitinophagales bacterium]|nr:PHP domain-containing protein [Chitinophagales bacterium]
MLLNCHTYYSFGYGSLSIEEMLDEARAKGYKKCIVTDINNTSACIDTMRLAAKYQMQAGIGIDFRNGIESKYIGIAKNNAGFKELNEHLSAHLHEEREFAQQSPPFEHAHIIYPFKQYGGWKLREHEYIGISHREILQIPFSLAKHQVEKMVILEPLTFVQKKHYNTHRLIRAIHENTLLSKLKENEQARPIETAITLAQILRQFEEYPIIIKNTERILEESEIDFEFGKFANKNLKFFRGSLREDMALLRAECAKGIALRYKNPSAEVQERVERELKVIEDMGFASYFLINWDIISYARYKNYFYIGRGSGANSLVAYLLRITNVDPIELDLYFERFINPFRSNPPDFDMDFSWTDRDDITRYIFDRFGRERTALLATYSTYQHDSVTRELGKVFGLPPHEIDKLQRLKTYEEADSVGKLVLQYSHLLQGLPNHLSIHSSGIIISEKPITCYSATFMPPKGYATTQFSMLEAEDIGLYKFDILSQRGLGKIKDAAVMVKEKYDIEIPLDDIDLFKKDEAVRDLLSVGKCIGCFYIESPAMRMLLAKLKASDYLRLVAASSIIRPGVSKSGMMREYILRFRNLEMRERAQKAIPVLYKILEETYGVMVYQEDVIKVAHY